MPRNSGGFGAKPQFGSVRRCFECNSPDHIRATCPRVRVGNNPGKMGQHQSGTPNQKSPQAHSHTPSQTQTSTSISRVQSEQLAVDQFDTRIGSNTKTVDTAKQVNYSVINPSLGDLQYIDVVLSDEAGTCSEVIHAVVDSGAEMCVARRDVIGALDCLTVGKVTLRGIIGEPFDAEVKCVYMCLP